MSNTSFSSPALSNVFCVTPPIAFDLKTGDFTNVDPYKAMVLADLCPSLNLDAEMNRAALWLLCNPKRRPDGALALFTFLVKRLTAAQARHDRGVIAHASH